MIALRLNPICRSNPSSDSEAQSPDLASGDVIFILVISRYFKYHLFKSILIGIAHDGSATASNFTGTPGANRVITVEKVIERLGISPATARRDINKLDESGKLKKVRNGAEAISQQRPRWTPMNIHQAQNHDEKVRIARAASQLVNPGESVVINCGSTAFLLGREMCGKPVQIITNYLPLANYLIDQEHESVVIMGGQYNKSQSITLSPQDSENSLYAGHWMFTSGKGLTADGLYKTDMLTAMAEQNMLNVVGKLVVLVDSSKVGERAGMLFSRAEQISMVITGKNANPEILSKLEDQGVTVLRV